MVNRRPLKGLWFPRLEAAVDGLYNNTFILNTIEIRKLIARAA